MAKQCLSEHLETWPKSQRGLHVVTTHKSPTISPVQVLDSSLHSQEVMDKNQTVKQRLQQRHHILLIHMTVKIKAIVSFVQSREENLFFRHSPRVEHCYVTIVRKTNKDLCLFFSFLRMKFFIRTFWNSQLCLKQLWRLCLNCIWIAWTINNHVKIYKREPNLFTYKPWQSFRLGIYSIYSMQKV